MQIELILLILSILFFASILAGKAGSRFCVPALLLFLGVGIRPVLGHRPYPLSHSPQLA